MNLLNLDQNLTLAINALHSPFGDTFFWIFTKIEVWIPLFVLLIILLWRELKWRKTLIIIAGALLALLLADQACNIIKLTVCRLRPTHEPELVGLVHTVNSYVGGDYGFCSSHAANTMALMLFTSLIIRRWQYTVELSTWVILSCWSRIYLGVHYVGDILCGLFVGATFAILSYYLTTVILKRSTLNQRSYSVETGLAPSSPNIPQPPVETERAPSPHNTSQPPVETERAPSPHNTSQPPVETQYAPSLLLLSPYPLTLLIILVYTCLTHQ